jgi:hypothetical protein
MQLVGIHPNECHSQLAKRIKWVRTVRNDQAINNFKTGAEKLVKLHEQFSFNSYL